MEKEPKNIRDEKIKEYGKDELKHGDLVRRDNKLFRVHIEDTGYTMRQFFSHSTEEMGPGPGWDGRWSVLEEYGVTNPSDLPDEPYIETLFFPIDEE